jgi:adenylosuccinate synthase
MSHTIIMGAQWGDEGKGKIVDMLAANADVVVRFSGGANAGHTIIVNGKKHVLHLIPSGILQPHAINLLGGGCVVDPHALLAEMATLNAAGISTGAERLVLAENAHIVTPYHQMIDKLSGGRVGTTGRGIGPAYADKALRIGVRLSDLRDGTAAAAIHAQYAHHGALARTLYDFHDVPAPDVVMAQLHDAAARLSGHIHDLVPHLLDADAREAKVLYEGAQGALLDVDHGTYPYVTSSNTNIAGAAAGLGVLTHFDRRIAVLKAYTTRVGNGPFPTELDDDVGARLREVGKEFGATTGRPRRCGWLDMPALKRTFRMNKFTHIALTKLDVLAGFPDIRVAVAHSSAQTGSKPEYQRFEGFDADLSLAKSIKDLPTACHRYVDFLEEQLDAKAFIISTGPNREHAIHTETAW